MSNNIGDPGHGHSPAAWTAVVIMLVAVSLGTLFFFLDTLGYDLFSQLGGKRHDRLDDAEAFFVLEHAANKTSVDL